MECGMVGWLVGSSPCVEVECGESIAGAWRLSTRVYKARDRMPGRRAALRTRRTLVHARTHSYARGTYAFRNVFYERSIFRGGGKGNFLGNLRLVCFPVAPMAEFSLRRRGYCPCNAPFFPRNVACPRVPVSRNVGFATARIFDAKFWNVPQPVALCVRHLFPKLSPTNFVVVSRSANAEGKPDCCC